MRCPKRPSCFDKAGIRRRVLASSCYPAFFRGHQRVGTPEYLSMMRLRKIWAEGSFSVLKREHCISKIRKRGILAATEECLLAAMALNLKRMVNAIFRYPQIYCSAGTSVGFSSFFAFVNRSLIVPYLIFGVRKHLAHGLQHPHALVANDELYAVQAAPRSHWKKLTQLALYSFNIKCRPGYRAVGIQGGNIVKKQPLNLLLA